MFKFSRTKIKLGGALSKSLALALCLLLPAIFNIACSSAPVVEVVTTDATRESALPAGAQPIALEPDLPAPDPDIEAAGDRIAEAITYLNTRRRERREVALRALGRAETALNHALRSNSHTDDTRNALHSALKDLDVAERAVQRNAPEAIRQLTTLNKKLDGISP